VLQKLLAVLDATIPDGVNWSAGLLPCPVLGPCWLFPRRMRRWRNLGGACGPSTPCPLHSRRCASLPCWGC